MRLYGIIIKISFFQRLGVVFVFKNIPEKYANRIVEMFKNDADSLHIYESITDNISYMLGLELIPEKPSALLCDLRDSGLIEEKSLPLFDVFCAKINEGVIKGTDETNFCIEIGLKISGSDDFKMCRIYALFLRDENNRITDIHYNIRPFSPKECFDRDVLKLFSSDKNPKIYSQRCVDVIKSHPGDDIAFIQFDVEQFKLINENHGVDIGDEILQFFNDSLALICSDEQPFCRLTADVYMIVTPYQSREQLIEFIHEIESKLCGYKGLEYRLAFGVAFVDDRTVHTRHHGDNASLARQMIKGNALENIGFFDSEDKAKLQRRKSIEDDMMKALLNREFVMYLQPKHSISTGRIIGAEALVRWIHPVQGMISPGDFIPVFEKNGFILKLDCFIWEEACKKIRRWIDNGISPVPISVNISREYMHSFDVVGKLTELVDRYNIPLDLLELEITESVDENDIEDVVKRMKEAGFKMLMDDFGSGYSSLNMLKSTPFDVLKIDRAFLGEFMDSDRGRKIIEHTISMSHDIGLDIIAEGVETIEQAKFLSRCGCDSAQGFYYSKPLSEAEFDKRLIEVNEL